jgi:hypothetical protein
MLVDRYQGSEAKPLGDVQAVRVHVPEHTFSVSG